MSKSRGNVVDPRAKLADVGADRLRYFLLREGRLKDDGDYNEPRFIDTVNELRLGVWLRI